MSNTNTGGPAFPPPLDVTLMAALTPQTGALGMTLRDYFAAKAMPTIAHEIYSMRQEVVDTTVPAFIAKMAYEYADAMMEARG